MDDTSKITITETALSNLIRDQGELVQFLKRLDERMVRSGDDRWAEAVRSAYALADDGLAGLFGVRFDHTHGTIDDEAPADPTLRTHSKNLI